MEKRALISGITGQDGSYLAELLLKKDYEVHGIIRRASQFNTARIDHLYSDPHNEAIRLHLHYGDLTDSSNLNRILEKIQPDEIYNLAAQSHVKVSFEVPEAMLPSMMFCLPERAACIIWSMVRSPFFKNRPQNRNVRS